MAKKHILMLSTFTKVMLGSKKEINYIIPDSYYKSIYEIDYNKLKNEQINTLLFDIDNTITYVDDVNVPKETYELIEKLKKQNFKILLMSNNNENRVKPISEKLNLLAISNAGKPDKKAYKNALKLIKSKKQNVAVIGDQILSDIVGAKKYGIKAILVDQLSKENNLQTGLAQKLQKFMVKKLTKKEKFTYKKYYSANN